MKGLRVRWVCFCSVAAASGWMLPSSHAPRAGRLLARTPHEDVADDDAAEAPAAEDVIDLQTFLPRRTPAERLASLSRACDDLGVESFDVYGDFEADAGASYLRRFEEEVAHHFGKEDAVFCLSGGMAQSIALLIHAGNRTGEEGRTRAFACHPTSHLLLHENDGFRELLGMEAVVLGPNYGSGAKYYPGALKNDGCFGMEPVRLSHVLDLLSPSEMHVTHPNLEKVSSVDVSTLILELPHREVGGKLTPWDEVEAMSLLCRERGVKFHCDGARILEASVGHGHASVKETAAPFDSVYISFYKGLGALSGAMLLGDADFVSEARVWLRRLGGNLYTVLPYAVSSWDGFRRNCLVRKENGDGEGELAYDPRVFVERRQKLARVADLLRADETVARIVAFDPSVPEVGLVHGYLRTSHEDCMAALERAEARTGVRVLSRVRAVGDGTVDDNKQFGCRFEWTMGEANSRIDDVVFLQGWQAFAEEATNGRKVERSI